MMQNKFIHVNAMEAERIRQDIMSINGLLLAELQGNDIQSWEEFIGKIEDTFKFPTTCIDSVDRYLDWIRDLD